MPTITQICNEELERLRELYLCKSPDDEGTWTKSILFEWGKFEFAPTEQNKQVEFYLTTKNAIEEFLKASHKRVLEGIVENLDTFYTTTNYIRDEKNPVPHDMMHGNNQAVSEIKQWIKEIIRDSLTKEIEGINI